MLAELVLAATLLGSPGGMDYDTRDLGPVDLSTKTVCVNIETTPVFAPLATQVYEKVAAFYQRYGVIVEFRPITSAEEYENDGLLAFILSPKNYLGSLGEHAYTTYGFANTSAGIIYMKDQRTDLGLLKKDGQEPYHDLTDEECVMLWSKVLAHELGHTFGLLHTDASVLDGIEEEYAGKYNVMGHYSVPLEESVLQPLQEMQVHSRLSGGKMDLLMKERALFSYPERVDEAIAQNERCLRGQE
jgi:hypothetical protein